MLNFIKRYWPTALASLILLTALTGVYAKYVTDQFFEGQATITANLGTIDLQEHKAMRDPTGLYTLTDTVLPYDETIGNAYTLIPGLDIPKDPYVQIIGKTTIPVYVFVEVKDNLPVSNSQITYSVDTTLWTKLEDVTGVNGGTVYVYNDAIDHNFGTNGTGTIRILTTDTNGNSVFVSQNLKEMTFPNDGFQIVFYANMGQVDAGNDASAVYTALFSPST